MTLNKEDPKEKKQLKRSLPAHTTSLEKYLADISNYPVLSRQEEYELAMRYKNDGDLEAARKLITSNLKFVIRIANSYKNYGLNPLDLIQEGNIGLMQAVKGFDPTKGYRLISYAVWWIRAYIQNYIIKSWSLVKIGTKQAQRKLFYKLRSTKQKMDIDDNLSPEDYKNLAEELGVSDEDVIEMDQRMGTKDLSLDAELTTKNDNTHLDFLTDDISNQEELISKSQEEENFKSGLEVALDSLKERERHIIKNRILSENPATLEKLGSELNISRERVRQIENSALKKIKTILEKRGLSK
ncbi:RNA polymerase sigma factor RpoH [Desulfobacterota bacterium AH_259_B03_O07]|nr:RNA polymerase sigma factor RpoH [Desulfobacterota bacterium AH_259_B03_O07]